MVSECHLIPISFIGSNAMLHKLPSAKPRSHCMVFSLCQGSETSHLYELSYHLCAPISPWYVDGIIIYTFWINPNGDQTHNCMVQGHPKCQGCPWDSRSSKMGSRHGTPVNNSNNRQNHSLFQPTVDHELYFLLKILVQSALVVKCAICCDLKNSTISVLKCSSSETKCVSAPNGSLLFHCLLRSYFNQKDEIIRPSEPVHQRFAQDLPNWTI